MRVIDTVKNTVERFASMLQDSFESATEWRGLNFACVSWANRRHGVGENESCLQQIEIAIAFHLAPIEVFPIEAS